MSQSHLEFEITQRIRRARKNNTIAVAIGLPFIGISGWLAVNDSFSMPLWLSPIILLVCLIGMGLVHHFDEATKGYFNAYCPECDHCVERSQFIGKELPEACPKCGLRVARF